MAITVAQLEAMNFGYLSGADLTQWCNAQHLISAYNSRPSLFAKAVPQAISEIRSKLYNIYDLTEELSLTDILSPIVTPVITGGVITGATIVQPGSNIISAPTAAAVDNTGSGATLTAVVSDSVVTAFDILDGGRHYRTAPAVVFVGGNPLRTAAATAIISTPTPHGPFLSPGGCVVSILLTDGGSGYQSVPTIQLNSVDGFGFCAHAVPLMTFGKLTGITIGAGGTTYSANTTISLTGSYQLADQREAKLVKMMAVFAVYNALGSFDNYSEKMMEDWKYVNKCLIDIRSGQDNLQLYGAKAQIRSDVKLVSDKFKQLG